MAKSDKKSHTPGSDGPKGRNKARRAEKAAAKGKSKPDGKADAMPRTVLGPVSGGQASRYASPGAAGLLAQTANLATRPPAPTAPAGSAAGAGVAVLDRLFTVVQSRLGADPSVSHSARLLSRGRSKVAQKFGEEAVECVIEAVSGNIDALIAESADVLYHLIVVWVSTGVTPGDVWSELARREGVSGVAEKAARAKPAEHSTLATTKIP